MDLLTIFMILGMVLSGSSILSEGRPPTTFNVRDFGAVGDGVKDDSQAFLAAWNAFCGSNPSGSPTLIIPVRHTFLLNPTTFGGPCKPPHVNVQVLGNIVAPKDKSAWSGHDVGNWLVFEHVDGLAVNGNGQIDGQGAVWWQQTSEFNKPNQSYVANEDTRPTAIRFNSCNNLRLDGVNFINSPSKHIQIFGCNGATVTKVHVNAPKESPNTDGIHISHSTNVQIHGCTIACGDDCISIIGNTSNINITGVACGPGHGISVGSLGGGGTTNTVEGVHVQDCSFDGTQNGVRIKTWQDGSGYARNISFHEITLVNTDNPIIIDQFYCADQTCPGRGKSAVQISHITYTNVHGTSAMDQAVTFNCSRTIKTIGCTNLFLDQINITSAVPGKPTSAFCSNAHGRAGVSIPPLGCLLK